MLCENVLNKNLGEKEIIFHYSKNKNLISVILFNESLTTTIFKMYRLSMFSTGSNQTNFSDEVGIYSVLTTLRNGAVLPL